MAGTRDYQFNTGPETATLPTATDPTSSADIVNKGYADINYGGTGSAVSGSRASPTSITAAGGITPGAYLNQTMFIQGSGGAIDITKNPQIAAGTTVGQKLLLIGRSDTNTVLLEDGTGLSLNGPHTMGADDTLYLVWDGTNWVEFARREN